jgi:dTDP-4-amino-4,6-dideoxygalactose transaminase
LPPGSEVLVSAITIRDMVRIIEAHHLVPVPVDLNPEDLSADIDSLQRAITPKTRAILVAHLFGTRQPMKPILEVARKHGLFVAEDCAQAFAGRHFTGDPAADVTMFSFGSIKTATALGGGLLCVRDREVLSRMREFQATYPIAFTKIVKRVDEAVRTGHNSALVLGMRLAGRDPDQFVASSVRGFPGPQLLPLIHRQPCAPLLAILHRRVAFFNRGALTRRTNRGRRLLSLLDGAVPIPGAEAQEHSFWVFPVLHAEPNQLIRRLLEVGFDASMAHSFFVVQEPQDRPEPSTTVSDDLLPHIVHLPCYAEMPDHELRRLAREVRLAVSRGDAEQTQRPQALSPAARQSHKIA